MLCVVRVCLGGRCLLFKGMGVDFTIEEKAGPKIPPMRSWEAVGISKHVTILRNFVVCCSFLHDEWMMVWLVARLLLLLQDVDHQSTLSVVISYLVPTLRSVVERHEKSAGIACVCCQIRLVFVGILR